LTNAAFARWSSSAVGVGERAGADVCAPMDDANAATMRIAEERERVR